MPMMACRSTRPRSFEKATGEMLVVTDAILPSFSTRSDGGRCRSADAISSTCRLTSAAAASTAGPYTTSEWLPPPGQQETQRGGGKQAGRVDGGQLEREPAAAGDALCPAESKRAVLEFEDNRRIVFRWNDAAPRTVELRFIPWQDSTYVQVTETGFEWQGRPYKSLSAVARDVCGQRWNGFLFFNLTGRNRKV